MTPKTETSLIYCKKCNKQFTREEWKTNKICENQDCNCPEVKKSLQAANDVIMKAQTSSKLNTIKIVTTSIPTERDKSVRQYEMDAAPITVITVTPAKKNV